MCDVIKYENVVPAVVQTIEADFNYTGKGLLWFTIAYSRTGRGRERVGRNEKAGALKALGGICIQ